VSHWFEGWRPQPDRKKRPVDGAYRQVRWVRPYRPGPWRVLAFLVGCVAVMVPLLVGLLVLLASTAPLVPRLIIAGCFCMISFGFGTLTGRVLSSGVYVNDDGLRLFTMRNTVTVPWSEIADVSGSRSRVAILGVPFLRADGEAVVVTTRDRGPTRTQVTSKGLDFLGRAQSYDAAALALERWWRDAPRDN